MFQKFKTIDQAFQQVRLLSIGLILGSLLLSAWAIYIGFAHAAKAQQRVYILVNGKVLSALSADRSENMPVEARDHIRTFQGLFFHLDPDEKVIGANMDRAFYLCDGSAKQLYD